MRLEQKSIKKSIETIHRKKSIKTTIDFFDGKCSIENKTIVFLMDFFDGFFRRIKNPSFSKNDGLFYIVFDQKNIARKNDGKKIHRFENDEKIHRKNRSQKSIARKFFIARTFKSGGFFSIV